MTPTEAKSSTNTPAADPPVAARQAAAPQQTAAAPQAVPEQAATPAAPKCHIPSVDLPSTPDQNVAVWVVNSPESFYIQVWEQYL